MESWQIIILLGAVAAVCAALLPRKNPRSDESKTVRNMETALEQFMENMEADNREIASLVTKSQKDSELLANKRDARVDELERRCAELEHALAEQARLVLAQLTRPSDPESPQPNASAIPEQQAPAHPTAAVAGFAAGVYPEEAEPGRQIAAQAPPTIRSRYAALFELHDGGKSVEAIARKLSMNKGEVQLILQFSRQEEAGRHE